MSNQNAAEEIFSKSEAPQGCFPGIRNVPQLNRHDHRVLASGFLSSFIRSGASFSILLVLIAIGKPPLMANDILPVYVGGDQQWKHKDLVFKANGDIVAVDDQVNGIFELPPLFGLKKVYLTNSKKSFELARKTSTFSLEIGAPVFRYTTYPTSVFIQMMDRLFESMPSTRPCICPIACGLGMTQPKDGKKLLRPGGIWLRKERLSSEYTNRRHEKYWRIAL